MKDISVFSLIRLESKDSGSENELFSRYQTYKNCGKNQDKTIDNSTIIELILKYINDKNKYQEFVEKIDEYGVEVTLVSDFKSFTDEEIHQFLLNDNFQPLIIYTLKNATSFSSIFLFLFFTSFYDYSSLLPELIEVLKFFSQSVFFSLHALSILEESEDYPELKHNFYYHKVMKKSFIDIDFYFNFPDKKITSLFYYLKNGTEYIDATKKMMNYEIDENKIDRKKLFSLIKHYYRSLTKYQDVNKFVQDFDSYFSENRDSKEALNAFLSYLEKNELDYAFLPDFVFTLFTRANNIYCFRFAIGIICVFPFKRKYKLLYDAIEEFAKYPSLTLFCIYALHSHPDFQTIAYRIAKNGDFEVQTQVIRYLDLRIKKNYCFVREAIKNMYIRQFVIDYLYNAINIDKMINLDSISDEDFGFLSNILLGIVANQELVNKHKTKIIEYIKKYFDKYKFSDSKYYHYFKSFLMRFCEFQAIADDIKNKIKYLVTDNFVYADETAFVDEALSSNKIDVDNISLMMGYLNYFPVVKLAKRFKTDPIKYIYFLTFIDNYQVHNLLDECVLFLDENLDCSSGHLQYNNLRFAKKKRKALEIHQEINLFTLLGKIIINPDVYYPNLYKAGLRNDDYSIRKIFYLNLKGINKIADIYDDELFSILEENYNNEIDPEILSIIDSILKINKVNIS